MAKKPFRFVNEDTVFTLPWEVGLLEGLFEKEGIAVEIAEKNPSNVAPELFGRNKETLFESNRLDAYNVCEWGAIKRTAVEGRRSSGILSLRESVTAMGIVAGKDAGITHPEDLAGVPVTVRMHTGSHYMVLHVERLRYVHPRPYSLDRYEMQARWMREWGLLDEGAKPEVVLAASC